MHISIAGMIGAGKTTLCQKLADVMHVDAYYEGVIDNVYLEDFYKDQARYAFPLQVYLLNERFKQQQQIVWSGKGAIQDRSIYEDKIFATVLRDDGHISERDYQTYCSLFDSMSNFMARPDLSIFRAHTLTYIISRLFGCSCQDQPRTDCDAIARL